MSLITYGFYTGARYITESIEFKIALIERELFNFKITIQEKKINFIEKEYIEFKKESKNIEFLVKDKEIVKFDTTQ